MKKGNNFSFVCLAILTSFLFLQVSASNGQTISFNQSTLDFKNFPVIESGTSLKFGPDNRLYVAQLKGEIKIYTIKKEDSHAYFVESEETILNVKYIPNYDDNGKLAYDKRVSRQITGITVAGTAAKPIIYVGSSDPKWGGPSGDKLLDTNSGTITRISWTGSKWEAIDLVRGLPRSEENHSTNGLEFTNIKGKPYLLVTSGGLTNAGAPSKNFTYISEFALSAAILSIDLNAIDALPTKTDGHSGRPYKYDLPTLDDPTRANVNGVYDPNNSNYNGIDVNDPFGGNDGLNMAMVTNSGPVQVFSPGYRNTYDLVVTENNRLYATNNGANANWGGLPINEGLAKSVNNNYNSAELGSNPATPSPSGEYVENQDHLVMISNNLENYIFGSFYGGHPAPIRANPGKPYTKGNSFPFSPGGAGLYTKFVGDNDNWKNVTPDFTPTDKFRTQILKPIAPGQPGFDNYAANSLPANWPPVPLANTNPAESNYITQTHNNPNGPNPDITTVLPNNSNGMDEYKGSNFKGAIKGALVIGKSKGELHLVHLNANGSLKKAEFSKWKLNGGNALGIACNSDKEIFPGTIWVATFDNRIMILTPEDNFTCMDKNHPDFEPLADYDHDGYTNQDEIDNGTDYCSGGSIPDDFDKDFISNLNDLDDDGDGIPDKDDPFQIGDPSNLPIINELFTNQIDPKGREFGYLGLGLTGMMNNGASNPNWLNWLDKGSASPGPNDIYGGTAGAIQVSMTGGTAKGKKNNQEKGFQFGANVGLETGIFSITSGLIGLSSPGQLYSYNGKGEIGIQMGDGTQNNFIKLVFTAEGVIASQEINNVEEKNPLFKAIPNQMRPGTNTMVQLSFEVDPVKGTVKPFYKFGNANPVALGTLTAKGRIKEAIQKMNVPLGIGIFGTSNDMSKSFIGVWDFFRVDGESPFPIMDLMDLTKNLNSPDESINLTQYFGDNGGANNLTFSVVKQTNPQIKTKIEQKILKISYPRSPANSEITIRATNANGLFAEQSFIVIVESQLEVIKRINTGGSDISGGSIGPDWDADIISGTFFSSGFSVRNGTVYSGTLSSDIRHSTIPDYISDQIYRDLFKTNKSGTGNEMEYIIPVENGEYLVNLYMGNGVESTSKASSRIYNIQIENNLVAEQFDLIQQFGHKVGGMKQYKVNVTDGEINIKLLKQKEAPLINAIEILGNSLQSPITYTAIMDQIDFPGKKMDGSFLIQASGGNGNLKYTANGLPPGVLLEPTNGTIYGRIDDNARAGSPYNVTINISDTHSNTTTFHFKWIISPELTEQTWKIKKESTSYTGRHENSFVQAGDKFYLMGGRENSKTIDVYDYQNNKWSSLTNISPESFNHFQATEYQGFIWVIGAFKDNKYPTESPAENVWIFDPAHKTWIMGPEIPVNRRRGSAGLVQYKDKFYVVGGNTKGHSGGYVNFFDEYDPKTGAWKVLNNAPRARDHFFANVIGDNLYVVSGRRSGGEGGVFAPVIPEVDVYNFKTKKWSTLSSDKNLPTPRAAAIVNNYLEKLIVAGGENMGSNKALSVTEAFDPVTQKWEKLAPLNFARQGTQGIVSGNGLYVLGGSPKRGGGNQKNMEYFGFDQPQGSPLVPGKIMSSPTVNLLKGKSQKLELSVGEGNMGTWVKSIALVGSNSKLFSLSSGKMDKMVFWPNGYIHELEILYSGTVSKVQAQIEVVYGNNLKRTISLVGNVEVEGGSDSKRVAIYYNTGSSSDLEMLGNTYLGDVKYPEIFTGGKIYVNKELSAHPLYQTERFGTKLNYKIPVPNGRYTVVTHHKETYFGVTGGGAKGGSGKRVFNIYIEGKLVKKNLDLYRENNNKPLALVFENIQVKDGTIDLNLVSSVNNATLAGFAIYNDATGVELLPQAKIIASKTSGAAPLEIFFDNSTVSSKSDYAYSWDFGDGQFSSVKNPTHVFSNPGTYTVQLVVRDGIGNKGTDQMVVSVVKPKSSTDIKPEEPSQFELFLNSGSNLSTQYLGNTFVGESNSEFSFSKSKTYSIDESDVQPLFSTERKGEDFTYSVPLPNGTYTVKTYHNELYFGRSGPAAKAGNRVYSIYLENLLVKRNLDLYTENKNLPTVLTFSNVEIKDGYLNLRMLSSASNASISGISVHSKEKIENIVLPNAVIQANVLKGLSPLTIQFTGSNSSGTGSLSYLWDFGNGNTSTNANPTFTYKSPGQFKVSLSVTDFYGNKDASNVMIEVLSKDSEDTKLWSFYLNAGTTSKTQYNGRQYLGDMGFPSYYNSTKTFKENDASDLAIFQTERYGTNLKYSIPVSNGIYRVKTLHNELYFGYTGPSGKAGNRVFDILIEGKLVKNDLDLFIENKNKPLVLVFENILISDGMLNINLLPKTNNATISGLVIERMSGSGTSNARIMEFGEQEVAAEENLEMNLPNVQIYPNPASQEAYIRLHEDLSLEMILVHDFSGKLVYDFDAREANGPLYVLPVNQFGQGVYLVTLIGKSGQMYQLRLVVER